MEKSETTLIGGKAPWRKEKINFTRLNANPQAQDSTPESKDRNANPQAQDSTPESKDRNSYLLVTHKRLIWTL